MVWLKLGKIYSASRHIGEELERNIDRYNWNVVINGWFYKFMFIYIGMVNPVDHWIQILFGTRLWIPLMELSGFWVNWILYFLKGIVWFPGYLRIGSSITHSYGSNLPVFLVFYVLCCWFKITQSHCTAFPYWVVLCDITRQVFLSLFSENICKWVFSILFLVFLTLDYNFVTNLVLVVILVHMFALGIMFN